MTAVYDGFGWAANGVHQAVDTAERASRWPSPLTGQMVLLTGSNTLTMFDGASWRTVGLT